MEGSRTTRRQFVVAAAGAAGSLALGSRAWARPRTAGGLPPAARSGLDHVVVVMMENRSFDHLLGWLPGANGKQAGLSYVDRLGVRRSTYRLAPDFQGCGHLGPDHSYEGGRVEFANGACDGFLKAPLSDIYAIGYYTRPDLPFLGEASTAWTTCDNYFAPLLGPTIPNRIYLHAGRTDRTNDLPVPTGLPTIWDRLRQGGLRGRYYQQNFSILALWGVKYASLVRPYSKFLRECRLGTLPEVSYVEPAYTLRFLGLGSDDHPNADIRVGESFLDEVYDAVTKSPAWPRTLLVIVFDEWGGFFDHVRPERGPDVAAKYEQRGFRVPCLLISPFARRRHVDHGLYDHTSILKLIEWRWNLRPLAVRDANAANLAHALDFSRRDLDAPEFTVPRVLSSRPC